MVEHSERESHLTPPLDALQWTIFGLVTIQHQNRQIKITSHPRPIDSARARAGAAQLSHQTLRGFGPRPISRCGAVNTRARRLVARRAFSPHSQRCSSLPATRFLAARRAIHCTRCEAWSLRLPFATWTREPGAEHTHSVLQNAVRSPVKHARRRSSICSREMRQARVVVHCTRVDVLAGRLSSINCRAAGHAAPGVAKRM